MGQVRNKIRQFFRAYKTEINSLPKIHKLWLIGIFLLFFSAVFMLLIYKGFSGGNNQINPIRHIQSIPLHTDSIHQSNK